MQPRNTKLVAPAIVRKLDPSIGGVDDVLRDLEAISLPRFQVGFPPQRLTLTLLGDFWADRPEPLPSAALVSLLAAFDVTGQAARVALGRLASRGALVMERRGRTTWYRQSPTLLRVLPQGRAVTTGFGAPRHGWDGNWSMVSWTMSGADAAQGHRIRTSLRELGFAPLNPGLWVSPDAAGESLHDVFSTGNVRYASFTSGDASFAGPASPRSAWDVEEIRPEYDAFVTMFDRELVSWRRKPKSAEAALVARIRAVYRWFVIATLDPDLPAELLPDDWPRTHARATFVSLVDLVTPIAYDHVHSVLGRHAPELAEFVTIPPPYAASPTA